MNKDTTAHLFAGLQAGVTTVATAEGASIEMLALVFTVARQDMQTGQHTLHELPALLMDPATALALSRAVETRLRELLPVQHAAAVAAEQSMQ